jgi:transcriptional regulator with XRE-family HTH domain
MNMSAPMKNPPVGPRVTKSLLTPFGVELRKLRLERGMRLSDLSKEISYSPSYLSALETGRRSVPDDFVITVASIFNLTEFEVAKLRRAAESSRAEVVIRPTSPEQLELAIEIEGKIKTLDSDRLRELVDRVRQFFHPHERACRVDFQVKKASRKGVAKRAKEFRSAFDVRDQERGEKFPIDKAVELVLPLCVPEFSFLVTPEDQMKGISGRACLSPPFIEVSDRVYREASEGISSGRWILAHELGHFWLAHGEGMRGPYRPASKKLPDTISAEWQADEFAGELLMPRSTCSKMTKDQIAEIFGVSEAVAKHRLSFIGEERSRVKEKD